MKKFLYAGVLALFSFNAFAQYHDGKFHPGADAQVRGKLPSIYFPSHWSTGLSIVANIRFNGEGGFWNPEYPVHPQSVTGDHDPQTYVRSFVELLFPSPDGENLTPNQLPSDPISQLTIDQIVKLIQFCNLSKERNISEAEVLDAVFPGVKISEEVKAVYKEFLKYEVVSRAQKIIDDEIFYYDEDDLEFTGFKDLEKGNPERYKKYLESYMWPLLEKGLDDKAIKEANDIARYFQLKSYASVSPKQRKEIEALEKALGEKKIGDYAFFKNNQTVLSVYRLVDTFLKALQEKDNLVENPIEQTLLGYVVSKFRTPEEWAEFYTKMGVDGLLPFLEKRDDRIEDAYSLTVTKSPDTCSSEDVAFLKGYSRLNDPYSFPIHYSTARVSIGKNGYEFSNCVEASIFSLLEMAARKKSVSGTYQIEAGAFQESSPLNGFFRKFDTVAKLHSMEAQNEFAQMTLGLENVRYAKSVPGTKNRYELKAGIINSLHVFGNLIPALRDSLLPVGYESTYEEISNGIGVLCSHLFGDEWSWEYSKDIEDLSAKNNGKEVLGNIIFKHNGTPVFSWEHVNSHASTHRLLRPSLTFSEDQLVHIMLNPELKQLISLEDIPEGMEKKFEGVNFMASSFNSPHSRRRAIMEIFTNPVYAHLKPLALSLLKAQVWDEEDGETPEDYADSAHGILASFVKFEEDGNASCIISMDSYAQLLRSGLVFLNPVSYESSRGKSYVSLTDILLKWGYKDLLIEIMPQLRFFPMDDTSTPEEKEFCKAMISRLRVSGCLSLNFSNFDDFQEVLSSCQSQLAKCHALHVIINHLDVPSEWSCEWVSSLKKNVSLFISEMVYESQEDLSQFFTNLFRVVPQAMVRGPGIEDRETGENLVERYRPALAGAGIRRGISSSSSDDE